MKGPVHEEPRILAAAERQMQAWTRTQEIKDRVARRHAIDQLAGEVQTCVCISREEGARGSEVARVLGAKLGWDVFDKNLLDRTAKQYHLSRFMLELVDETQSNWVHDVLGTFVDRKVVSHEKYVAHLGHVVLAAARRGHAIFVGRGAQFLLPRDKGLAVRLIAPMSFRVAEVMRREHLDQPGARRLIDECDLGRHEFVERYFHHNTDDPHLYDLVINVEQLDPASTADQILAALRLYSATSRR